MTRVGFIGTGRMGAPMVRRLVDAGHEVRALGRTPEKASAVDRFGRLRGERSGGRRRGRRRRHRLRVHRRPGAPGLPRATAWSPPCHPDAVLVVHTTGSPRTAQSIAALGVDVVDAPVSGGPHDVAAGRVTLFVGGEDDAVKRVHPLLSTYGDPVLHVGRTGTGQLVKLINNALFAAQIGLVAEGVRLGGRARRPRTHPARGAHARQRGQPRAGQYRAGGVDGSLHRLRRRLHRQRRRDGPRNGRRTGRRPRTALHDIVDDGAAPMRHILRMPHSLLWKRHYR